MGLQMCWYEYTRIQTCRWKIKMLTLSHEEDVTQIFEWIYSWRQTQYSWCPRLGRGGGGYSKIWARLRYEPTESPWFLKTLILKKNIIFALVGIAFMVWSLNTQISIMKVIWWRFVSCHLILILYFSLGRELSHPSIGSGWHTPIQSLWKNPPLPGTWWM